MNEEQQKPVFPIPIPLAISPCCEAPVQWGVWRENPYQDEGGEGE